MDETMRRALLLIVVSVSMLFLCSHAVLGQETGFLARLNPFRRLGTGPEERRWGSETDEDTPAGIGRRESHAPWTADGSPDATPRRYRNGRQIRWQRQGQAENETVSAPRDAERHARPPWRTDASADRSPVAAEYQGGPFGHRSVEGNPPTAEQLRAHLLARGVDPTIVDRQIDHLVSKRNGPRSRVEKRSTDPSQRLERIRAEMRARGIEPRQANRQLPRSTRSRAMRQRVQERLAEGRFGNQPAEQRELRARIVRSEVEPRTASDRLGRPSTVPARAQTAARLGAGRTRRK